jgi:predicted nucleotidyltransferase
VLSLESELRQLVQRFNEAKIEYALCGGMAVALHGYPRFTKDIDFLVPSESLNRAIEVAATAGFLDDSGRIPFPDSDVYRILKIEGSEYRILDLLVPKSLDTLAWKQRQWFDWNGLPICSVSREGLIEMKLAAGRDIDRIDIKQLGYIEDE